MNKKLLISYHSAQYGGVEKHILDLIDCVSRNIDCTVACPDGPMVEKYKKAGAKYINLYARNEYDIQFVKDLRNYLVSNKIDIVHGHELRSGFLSMLAGFLAGTKKRIYHVHTPFIFWKHNIVKKYIALVINTIANFIAGNFFATDVIALTPYIASIRESREFIFRNKIRIIPNGVDLNEYKKDVKLRKSFRDKYKIKEGALVISNLSRFTPEKGHTDLVRAISAVVKLNKNRDLKFVLAGSKGSIFNDIKKMTVDSKIANSIIFIPDISDDDKKALYNATDIFVFPSHAEGFGIVLIEAMAEKLPIISSDIPVLKDVANNAVCYFRARNYRDLTEKMQSLIIDSKLRNDYANKSYNRSKLYSMENFCKLYNNLYTT